MDLTVHIRQLSNSRYKATISKLPGIFYIGGSEAEVNERINRLVHALKSPHVQIGQVLPDGDVVLLLDRRLKGVPIPSPFDLHMQGCALAMG